MALGERLKVSLNQCLNRFNIFRKYMYYDFRLNSYIEKWTFQDFSNIDALGIKFGLAVKKYQGQPCFIICANLVRPTSPMLYTKSQDYWPYGSRVEDI